MQGDGASIFTVEQEQALLRLKAYFPYRVVFGCIDQNGVFEHYADKTRRNLNKRIKEGWLCATVAAAPECLFNTWEGN